MGLSSVAVMANSLLLRLELRPVRRTDGTSKSISAESTANVHVNKHQHIPEKIDVQKSKGDEDVEAGEIKAHWQGVQGR